MKLTHSIQLRCATVVVAGAGNSLAISFPGSRRLEISDILQETPLSRSRVMRI